MEVERGRYHAFLERLHGSHGCDRPGSPERMPDGRLGGGHADLRSVLADERIDAHQLGRVALAGAGGVGADKVDVARFEARLVEGSPGCPDGAGTPGAREE